MKIPQLTDWTLQDELAREDEAFVVLFTVTDCRACDRPREEFRLLREGYPDVPFYEIDLAENPSLAKAYDIRQVPTTLVFFGGAEAARHVGPGMTGMVRSSLGMREEEP
jgi:thioredoxin 1